MEKRSRKSAQRAAANIGNLEVIFDCFELSGGGSSRIGLDLGERSSYYCVLDESGGMLRERRIANEPRAIKEVSGNMAQPRITLERGVHWPRVSRLRSEVGHE